MSRPAAGPRAPRAAAPDLPRHLDEGADLVRHRTHDQLRVAGLSGVVDAAHAQLNECVIAAPVAERLDLTGAGLVDVEIVDARVPAVSASTGRWRSVRISGGRIGALEMSRGEFDAIELRGVRIDYLSLALSQLTDVLIADCRIGSLDLPQSRLTRVRFDDCRVEEIDTRDLRATDVDLRGIHTLRVTDPRALRGVTLTPRQIEDLAPSLAASLGIDVRD